jgi:hypothetical protein
MGWKGKEAVIHENISEPFLPLQSRQVTCLIFDVEISLVFINDSDAPFAIGEQVPGISFDLTQFHMWSRFTLIR